MDDFWNPKSILCCQCQQETPIQMSSQCSVCSHEFCDLLVVNRRNMKCGHQIYTVNWGWLICGIILYLLFGLMTYVGAVIMGYRMPIYPEFLSYFPAFIYTVIFGIGAGLNGESFRISREIQKECLWLGLWIGLNGVLWQFAVPHISTELSNILSQITYPVTWIIGWYMFRWEVNVFKVVCCLFTLASVGLAIIPSSSESSSNSIWWILVSILSTIPAAFITTYQERAFKDKGAPVWICLMYSNLYSLIIYVVLIPLQMTALQMGGPLTWEQLWTNQLEAFQCFFGLAHLEYCLPGATIWVLIFTCGWIGMFVFGALLLRVHDSILLANLNILLIPGASIIMWLPFIVGADAENPEWWIILSLILLMMSTFLYERYSESEPPGCLSYTLLDSGYQFGWER